MSWLKVGMKFLKGVFFGGIGSVISDPSVLSGGDLKKTGIISLVVGILSGVLNWYKHKDDK